LTTVGGALVILEAIGQLIWFTIEESGMPHDTSTWISFAGKVTTGIVLILTKSYNVSNSPTPAAPTVVSAVNMVKANPSALVNVNQSANV
jgi:hypothetical protein